MKHFLLVLGILATTAHAANWKKFHLINGCHVMNSEGDSLKNFPGALCQFFEDGSYLSATINRLTYFDKNNAPKWEMKGVFHHQLNLSQDRKRILVLSNSTIPGQQKLEDHLLVLDFNGKVIHEARSTDFLKQLNRTDHSYTPEEITHINSFYEIPEMHSGLKLPEYIRAGNYIINDYRLGAMVLSSDLKKVLHFFPMESADNNRTHDVQILSSGRMIYFNNVVKNKAKSLFSSVNVTHLETGVDESLFVANPAETFFSLFCGGVQELDSEHILFSHMLTGTFIYSLKEKKILANLYKTHLQHDRFYPSQQVKAQDLSKFMTHWK